MVFIVLRRDGRHIILLYYNSGVKTLFPISINSIVPTKVIAAIWERGEIAKKYV